MFEDLMKSERLQRLVLYVANNPEKTGKQIVSEFDDGITSRSYGYKLIDRAEKDHLIMGWDSKGEGIFWVATPAGIGYAQIVQQERRRGK